MRKTLLLCFMAMASMAQSYAQNLWENAEKSVTFYYAPNWAQIEDPMYEAENGGYVWTLPTATNNMWQAQAKIEASLPTSTEEEYDFSCSIVSDVNLSGVTVKLYQQGNDEVFYFTESLTLKANEAKEIKKVKMAGLDMNKVTLLVDCGGNPANTTIAVENIVFQVNSGEEPEPEPILEPYDYDSSCNLIKAAEREISFYYAPNWAQIADPEVTEENGVYSYTLTQATSNMWQAQFFFDTDIATNSSTNYDFSVTITSSTDAKVTVKLYQKGQNDIAYFTDTYTATAREAKVIRHDDMGGIDLTDLRLLIDCGGNPANTTMTVAGPVFKEHDCEASGIDNYNSTAVETEAPIYNLAGQRITESFKGIRIQKGKKYVK